MTQESLYKLRVTIAVPVAHKDIANQLALFIGENINDIKTFERPASFKDSNNNEYIVASTVATHSLYPKVNPPLAYPDYLAEDDTVSDITKAHTALSMLTVIDTSDEDHMANKDPLITPNRIIAIIDNNQFKAIEMMGLSRIEETV